MKRILVVLTGGTIGSRVEERQIDVSEKSPYRLLQMYEDTYEKGADFEVIQPMNLLSENMTPKGWSALVQALWKLPFEQYGGVIITHGSDTLSYTSAMLGFLFWNVPVPIVLVASNYALGMPGSNGLNNFKQAVDFIRTESMQGVFTIYQNQAGENQVFSATEIVEADPYADQFQSFTGSPLGKMEAGVFIKHKKSVGRKPEKVLLPDENPVYEREGKEPIVFTREIMLIRPYPGMNYRWMNPESKPAAVLHYLYHSATACTSGEDYDILSFIKRCRDCGIDFYTASYKSLEGEKYATADAILKAGAKPLLNLSAEAAYAKLMLLYNGGVKIK